MKNNPKGIIDLCSQMNSHKGEASEAVSSQCRLVNEAFRTLKARSYLSASQTNGHSAEPDNIMWLKIFAAIGLVVQLVSKAFGADCTDAAVQVASPSGGIAISEHNMGVSSGFRLTTFFMSEVKRLMAFQGDPAPVGAYFKWSCFVPGKTGVRPSYASMFTCTASGLRSEFCR